MVVVHHCCQLGLGGKHITAPSCLCRHLGLFAITEYDMTALRSALKFYWLLRQVPQPQCVLQAGSLSGESRGPGFLHCGLAGRGRGLSRGRSPRAPRRKQGKNYGEPACRCVCVSVDIPGWRGQAASCLQGQSAELPALSSLCNAYPRA